MEKRSPIKEQPLRHAGQSTAQEMRQIAIKRAVIPGTALATLALVVSVEMLGNLFKWPSLLPLYFVLMIIMFIIIMIRMKIAGPKMDQLRLARDGERTVGQALEKTREHAYQVFHDIEKPGGFNVDHVLVGPGGVFVIETKTCRKPKGDAHVAYDGNSVTVDGYKPDRDPIFQAKALTNWVSELLRKETGQSFPMRGVVLYPGWYVDDQPRGCEIWVLNEKSLQGFLRHEEVRLNSDRIVVAAEALARYVRRTEAEK